MASKPGGGRGGRKKFTSKGGNRHFSDFEELKKQNEEIKREKALQQARQDAGEETDEDDQPAKTEKPKVVNFDAKLEKAKKPAKKGPRDGSDSASSSEGGGASSSDADDEEDDKGAAKGVQHLIDIDNPNRQQQKMKKLKDLNFDESGPSTETTAADGGEKQPLSRKEREALEAERKKKEYQRLHALGKTDEARADLARLALIKKQREDAAKKRDDEKKAKEEADVKQTKEKLAGKH